MRHHKILATISELHQHMHVNRQKILQFANKRNEMAWLIGMRALYRMSHIESDWWCVRERLKREKKKKHH